MKILLISNMYPSISSPGYGVFVQNFENGIVECGGILNKVVIRGKGKNKLEKIFKYIIFFYDTYKALLRKDYDAIYVHYIAHSLLPLVLISPLLKKTLILNAHGEDVLIDTKLGVLIKKIVTPLIQKANMIVVPSEYFKLEVMEKFSIEKNKIFISASGGIDTTLFRPIEDLKSNALFTIGYVSRIDEGKGWDTLLLATKELKNQIAMPFKVIIIGGGVQEDTLRTMIIQLELQNEIEYLGAIRHDVLPTYYNKFNLFAFTTRLAESLGLVGLEAMACGVPVIGSNIGGLRGYIKNGYNGELFEPVNHYQLAEKIKNFMQLADEEKIVMQNNAISTALKYDSKIVNLKLYDVLMNIIEMNRRN